MKTANRFRKISWKLTFSYAAMFSIVLIVLSVSIVWGIKYYLTEQALSQVENSAAITMVNIIDTFHEQGELTDPELLSEAVADSQISISIADQNGQIVSSSSNTGNVNIGITEDCGTARVVELGDSRFAIVNERVEIEGQTKAYLQVIKNLVSEYSFLRVAAFASLVADAVGIVVSLLIGFIISKRMLRPIDKITTTAKEISISDLNRKIELRGNDDELDRLAKTFNEMIERLRLSFEKQNSFVSDASHELRTPIAVIRGYIDLVDRWGKEDRAVLGEAIEAIKNETQDMGNMVERLLFLARSDTGKLNIKKERFPLSELIEEIILEYQLIVPDQKFIKELQEPILAEADRSLIKQVLRAIIDNSIKYDPSHRSIIVSTKAHAGEVQISVQDFGVGIPEEKIKGIFERFYRADSARERETGGAGLGLAIAQTIVNSHGGGITAQSEGGKGTTITIHLPQEL